MTMVAWARGALVSLIFALGCSPKAAPTEVAQAPSQASAVAVGAPAPAAQLVGTTGTKVALADLLHQHAQSVVVFYRGFW
ncbi:MAG TPA: hypothetical protein VHW23_30165 [Kofleriaceae bacterium]|jgi:uncharacterized protein YcfL|nr:hypothetical protein [Kofleriaceae bacterium]